MSARSFEYCCNCDQLTEPCEGELCSKCGGFVCNECKRTGDDYTVPFCPVCYEDLTIKAKELSE